MKEDISNVEHRKWKRPHEFAHQAIATIVESSCTIGSLGRAARQPPIGGGQQMAEKLRAIFDCQPRLACL